MRAIGGCPGSALCGEGTMNDNDAPERVCRFCNKPTTESEFFTIPSGRQWAHFACALQAGREALASGKLDNVRMAIDWDDDTADIRTGEQLREGQPVAKGKR